MASAATANQTTEAETAQQSPLLDKRKILTLKQKESLINVDKSTEKYFGLSMKQP